MGDNTTAADKRIVEQLDYDSKTAKRVGWEGFEFSVIGSHQVRVTNAAYGFLKEEHSYTVGVAVVDGRALPAECNCPADIHREPDCKHKVAVATLGGPVVLQAAVECPTLSRETGTSESTTLADRLRSDGGTVSEETRDAAAALIEDERKGCDNDWCDGPEGGNLPCFECFELSEEQ